MGHPMLIRSKCVLDRIGRLYLSNTMFEKVLEIGNIPKRKTDGEMRGRGGVERKTEREDNDLRRCE